MDIKLDQYLCSAFPAILVDRKAPVHQSPMFWGFSCGDGWFHIIRRLCFRLERFFAAFDKVNPELAGKWKEFKFVQVKEKFGTLRVYPNMNCIEINSFISDAEGESAITCEMCGGDAMLRKGTWWRTLCDPCESEREFVNRATYLKKDGVLGE